MSGPSQIVRERREAGARRRLEIAKLLRADPATTNKQLAKALNVNRNTIALDRRIIMEELQKNTLTETELMRAEMVAKLESLNEELELHRDGEKLPVSVIHEMLLVQRSLIELLGVRKPVVEKVEVKRSPIQFETIIVSTDPRGERTPKRVTEWKEPLTLEAGDPHGD